MGGENLPFFQSPRLAADLHKNGLFSGFEMARKLDFSRWRRSAKCTLSGPGERLRADNLDMSGFDARALNRSRWNASPAPGTPPAAARHPYTDSPSSSRTYWRQTAGRGVPLVNWRVPSCINGPRGAAGGAPEARLHENLLHLRSCRSDSPLVLTLKKNRNAHSSCVRCDGQRVSRISPETRNGRSLVQGNTIAPSA